MRAAASLRKGSPPPNEFGGCHFTTGSSAGTTEGSWHIGQVDDCGARRRLEGEEGGVETGVQFDLALHLGKAATAKLP